MGEWTPVQRVDVEVKGIDPEYSGLLNVVVQLDREPHTTWWSYFLRPVGVGMSLSMHAPEQGHGAIRLRPSDNEVEKYVTHVDERIAAANERYRTEELPRQRAEQERRNAEQADQERRIDEASKRLKGL